MFLKTLDKNRKNNFLNIDIYKKLHYEDTFMMMLNQLTISIV